MQLASSRDDSLNSKYAIFNQLCRPRNFNKKFVKWKNEKKKNCFFEKWIILRGDTAMNL